MESQPQNQDLFDNMDGVDPPIEGTIVECMVNHVFLPLGLPNRPDKEPCDSHLLDLFLSSAKEFVSLCNNSEQSKVNQLIIALQDFQNIRKEDGSLHSENLRTASQQVIGQGTSYLPIYVQAQNAGILLHRQGANTIFDLWGSTPDDETIVEAPGRIVRHFPECSASIPTDDVNTYDFLDFISSALARMSWEGITSSQSHGFREVAAASQDVPSPTNITELLYIERKQKLELTEDEKWMDAATVVLKNAEEVLMQNWQKTIKRHQISLEISPVSPSAIEADALFDIPGLNLFVNSITHRQSAATSDSYNPVSQLRLTDKNTFASLALAEEAKEYTIFYIFAFEHWIDKHLDIWLKNHGTGGDACNTIKNRAFQYFKIARKAYENNPKENSAMLLRILMLWVACDKIAAADTPELKCCKPPVPHNIWSSLLLSSKTDIEQLKKAEGYLKYRQEHSQYGTSVFEDLGGKPSFAVKAFENDPNCKKLLKDLIKYDKDKESEKIEELDQQIEDYSRLMQEYHDGHCDAGCEEASDSED
ncbi:hypothetical protein J3458_001154 [Metarhizium acridum]|uniref:uncharacterized protein n=1 Tax=Metarhizium acridum TaxID=92637 RepID=UPI001C6B8A18|nr:hypothetical protein J3458_001154 [Metarhizium acridum]